MKYRNRLGANLVRFTASGRDTASFLSLCLGAGIQLSGVESALGGLSACGAAADYRRMVPLARRCGVRLRVMRRRGVGFALAELCRRPGLWVGALLFALVLRWSGGLLWAVRMADIPVSEQAALRGILAEQGLCEGSRVDEELLERAQDRLRNTPGFGWAALNFYRGRLVAERTEEVPAQPLPAPTAVDLTASDIAEILNTNVHSGFCLVERGQTVAAGQVLVSASRFDRSGEPVWQETDGEVLGLVSREYRAFRSFEEETICPTGRWAVTQSLYTPFGEFALPGGAAFPSEVCSVAAEPVAPGGFSLPLTLTRTLHAETGTIHRTLSREAVHQFVRYRCRCLLYADYPDAVIHQESAVENWQDSGLDYLWRVTFAANIARRG